MNDDASSIGAASAAVAMANDAIDNARRAAASSRNRRKNAAPPPAAQNYMYSAPSKPPPSHAPHTPNPNPIPGTAEFVKNSPGSFSNSGNKFTTPVTGGAAQSELDLKHNDNAYHVIATLVTERLVPKIHANPGSAHYTLTSDDTAFFQKMLPYSVRRSFVDALRYRLQLVKSGIGSRHSALGKLSMQCQMLGLERENLNVLLDLGSSAGMSYPINFKGQGPVAVPSPEKDPYGTASNNNGQYDNIGSNNSTRQSYNIHTSGNDGDNGVSFGLNSPMAFSPTTTTFSPTNQSAGVMGSNSNYGLQNNMSGNPNNTNDWETSAESLARQQIMAEINETKFLMRGSVTPDAVNFWKKHLEELSQRLVALSLEEQLQAAGSNAGGGGGGSMAGAQPGSFGGMGNNSGIGNDRFNDTNNIEMHDRVKKHYNNKPQIQTQEEYLENNRRMREEMGMGGVVASPASMSAMESGVGSYHHPTQHGDHVLEATVEAVASMPKQLDELPVCDVVAPSDLPGGYMFEAQLGANKFLATVPPGGVTKGQRFVSTMRELETIEIPVPLGAWRDGGKECCRDGILHPLFLNTLFFPCIALGQIMTRTGLDWQGEPSNKLVSGLSCVNMTVLLTFYLSMNASAAFMIRVAWERGMLVGQYYLTTILFNFFFLVYMINLTRKVRASVRNKYQIPEEKCEGLEDCMCATFCMPCAICQMGRHTADFDTYRATCCTKTGLPRQVELAPVSFYEDQYQNMNEESQQDGHVM